MSRQNAGRPRVAPPEIDCNEPVKLIDRPGLPEQYHKFEPESALAIRAALGACRPLLVRGEPGVGKTQLAAAAAKVLKRPLVQKVVEARTESRDLLWEFDAVLRLAEAQVAGAVGSLSLARAGQDPAGDGIEDPRESLINLLRARLDPGRFVRPGPLWWSFDWDDARRQAEKSSSPVPKLDDGAGFDLRLMSPLNGVSNIPTEGKDLIIVAAVNNLLHFRIFDGDGKVVVDIDEQRLTEQARQIEDLRKQLESLWHPHELTRSDKVRVTTAVTSIVGHSHGADPQNGCVVLIDEIDKADPDVPNGLLEALGAGQFTPLGQNEPVKVQNQFPLVIITTNEERVLPNAFVRRCLVLHLKLPKDDGPLIDYLVARAQVHFPQVAKAKESIELFQRAADLLVKDRRQAIERHVTPLPGQAEYLDLIRAVLDLEPDSPAGQSKLLESVAAYALRKHEEPGS